MTANIEIKGIKSQSVRIPVPVTSPAQREIEIKLKDAKTGRTFYEATINDTSVLKIMSSFSSAQQTDRIYTFSISQI